ncbi:MAG: methionine--tRNA ligase [Planctomycetes bacterium]|nr:methionine--tRNA ligase [Planctomycetota bacterium]
MSRERFYVTTPIYYVNDAPHIGHAYTTVLADVLARAHRMLGVPTWFLTGTDEHGLKVQQAAEAKGVPPQEICDTYSQRFRELHARLGVRYDDFIRTTEPRHKTVVSRVLTLLHERGEVYRAEYEGWYCTRCERYFNDTDVQAAGGRCPDQPVLHDVARLKESNYFFRMGKWAAELARRIESGEMELAPEKRKNEVLGFLRKPVDDLCISRSKARLSWGVDLPFDADYVTYVWVDALFNYKSAIGYLSDDPAARERHATWWAHATHILGKDILTTHAVYWPTMLLAAGESLPRKLLAHGWLLDATGLKVSKTKREGVTDQGPPPPSIDALLDVLGTDVTRWLLATAMKPGDDAAFSWDLVRERVNAELANGFGNSVNRVVKMAHQACGGKFPGLGGGGPRGDSLREKTLAVVAAVSAVPETLDMLAVNAAVRVAVAEMSGYLDDEKPWKLAKDPAQTGRVAGILADCIESLRLLGLALSPIFPEKCAVLRATLGQPAATDFVAEARWGVLTAGTPLGEPPNLFPRFDDAKLAALPQ